MVRKGASTTTESAAPAPVKKVTVAPTTTSTAGKSGRAARKIVYKYFIDASVPANDGIFDLDHFQKYIAENFKVDGRKNNLRGKVRFQKKEDKLHFYSDIFFTKTYIRFLAKKYLKKQELKDYLRVVSLGNKPHERAYKLVYYSIKGEDTTKEEGAETKEEQQ